MSFTYEERDVLMAEITELRAELAEAKRQAWADKYCLDADQRAIAELQAALARVRELCDETDGPSTVRKDVIRAAIEGNQP